MSTLKVDALTTKSDNADLTITGGGTGVPNLETGYKVNGTVEKLTGIAPSTSGNVLTSDGTDWTSAAAGGGPSQATQAALEAETNEDTYAPPDLIKHNPGVAKGWVKFSNAAAVSVSFNVSSVTDNGTGIWTVNWNVNFSSANYSVTGVTLVTGTGNRPVMVRSQAAGTTQIITTHSADGLSENVISDIFVQAFGDQ